MTAVFTVSIVCECECSGDIKRGVKHGCHRTFPAQPVVSTAKELRLDAEARGWEVLRHTRGRDICPPCRVAEIQAAMNTAVAEADPPPVDPGVPILNHPGSDRWTGGDRKDEP